MNVSGSPCALLLANHGTKEPQLGENCDKTGRSKQHDILQYYSDLFSWVIALSFDLTQHWTPKGHRERAKHSLKCLVDVYRYSHMNRSLRSACAALSLAVWLSPSIWRTLKSIHGSLKSIWRFLKSKKLLLE